MPVILLKGRLYGLDRESDCEIIAWRPVEHSIPAYSQMRVVNVLRDLPDGLYTLVVESRVYSTEKREGLWQMVLLERATA